MPRRFLSFALVVCVLACLATPAASGPRVIILGFDGVDDAMTRKLMEEGHLPNLKRLAERGAYRPLLSTNPAQSPVSWAAFATGTNPGKTGIYDFLKRRPGTYDPDLAMVAKVMSAEFTPDSQKRWILLRIVPGIVLLLLCWIVVGLILKKRVLWIGVGLAAAVGWGFLVENVGFFGLIPPLKHVPYELPTGVNLRQGRTFWQMLDDKDLRCVVVEGPTSFPADVTKHGKVLAGLGVPDVLGTFGIYVVVTNDVLVPDKTEMGAIIRHLEPDADGNVRAWIRGPENFLLEESVKSDLRKRMRRLREQLDLGMADSATVRERLLERERELYPCIPLDLKLDTVNHRAVIEVQGQKRTIEVGKWSDHLELEFELNPVLKPSGITRFYLSRCDDKAYTLVLSMINWNPKKVPPNVKLTYPHEWAGELADSLDFFDTLGWACVTSGLKDEILSEEAFLAHINLLWDARERKTFHLLDQGDWDCFISVLSETDRVQHMMWRLIDEKSPRYDAELAAKFGDSIRKVYQRMDSLVGRVMTEHLDEDTVLFVCSDHGFQSFRRSVNLNTWLVRNGFMKLKGQGAQLSLDDLFDPDAEGGFGNVDWTETKAYSMGLGKIYINLAGREPAGIVDPDDYDEVRGQIIDGLMKLRDEDGTQVVEAVYPRETLYSGARMEFAEDLVMGFRPGYRVGWQTTLGGAPPDVLEDNNQKWSGDHCSFDPKFVKGILFSSVPVEAAEPSIMDLGPTVLSIMGLPAAPVMDGEVIIGTK